MDCWNCDVNIDRQASFKVITPHGIADVCRDCFDILDYPPVEKKEVSIAPKPIFPQKRRQENSSVEQDQELKKLVEKNYSLKKAISRPDDLIENFHWVIMRVRRTKKLTQPQFAREIREPDVVVRKLEQGYLPENYSVLIKKVETYLRINLSKNKPQSFEDSVEEVKENLIKASDSGEVHFDEVTTKTLTLNDLQEMKMKQERKILDSNNIEMQEEKIEEIPKKRGLFSWRKKEKEKIVEEEYPQERKTLSFNIPERKETQSVPERNSFNFNRNENIKRVESKPEISSPKENISRNINSRERFQNRERQNQRRNLPTNMNERDKLAEERFESIEKKLSSKKDLTDKELDDLIFGRKD